VPSSASGHLERVCPARGLCPARLPETPLARHVRLADDKKIEDYNVAPGGTIHMVLQLRGGAP